MMPDNILFSLVFLSQILLISLWLPAKVRSHARHILTTYPAEQYPRLYPKSAATYERALVHFTWINAVIFLIALFFWLVFNFDESNDDYAGVAWAIFMLQSLPFILLEFFTLRTWKLMQEADIRTTRTASLQPRRIKDIVSPFQLSILAVSFLIFCVFIAYVNQFNFPWFGGYLNVVILGAGYCFLGGIILWNLYTKKRDPYLEEADRLNRIRYMAKQFVFVCVAVTIYGMISISLQAFELREFKQLAMSIYCQVLAVSCFFTVYQDRYVNYEVYREETPSTAT